MKSASFQPNLESLEDRFSPAVYSWRGTSTNFNAASSWLVGGQVAENAPGSSDTCNILQKTMMPIVTANITIAALNMDPQSPESPLTGTLTLQANLTIDATNASHASPLIQGKIRIEGGNHSLIFANQPSDKPLTLANTIEAESSYTTTLELRGVVATTAGTSSSTFKLDSVDYFKIDETSGSGDSTVLTISNSTGNGLKIANEATEIQVYFGEIVVQPITALNTRAHVLCLDDTAKWAKIQLLGGTMRFGGPAVANGFNAIRPAVEVRQGGALVFEDQSKVDFTCNTSSYAVDVTNANSTFSVEGDVEIKATGTSLTHAINVHTAGRVVFDSSSDDEVARLQTGLRLNGAFVDFQGAGRFSTIDVDNLSIVGESEFTMRAWKIAGSTFTDKIHSRDDIVAWETGHDVHVSTSDSFSANDDLFFFTWVDEWREQSPQNAFSFDGITFSATIADHTTNPRKFGIRV